MGEYRFAGYRVVEFPAESKSLLKEIAGLLIPHENEIVDNWVKLQFDAWQPPGISKEQIRVVFGDLVRDILECMNAKTLELCVEHLEETGNHLALINFPYEALIISVHFFEESYMPFVLEARSPKTQDWLITMDEFLHAGLAALASSYFQFHRQQLLAEVEIGRTVQEALFPHPPRRLADLDIGFVYASASEKARIGGDFLDVFKFGPDRIAFVIGDLSGHGLEAAADASMIRNLFKGFLLDRADLTDSISRLNAVLSKELEIHQFATLMAGLYEPNGKLTLVSAGGPTPIILETGNPVISRPGLPLGVDTSAEYEKVELVLRPSDTLLAFTDGLTEARVGADLFGESRILSAISEVIDTSPRAIAEHLMDKALHHTNGRLLDDMAILVMRRTPES